MRLRNGQRGDTLIEVTIACAILASVLATCYVLAIKAFQLSQAAKERRQITELLQQQVEYMHSLRDNSANWTAFTDAIHPECGASPTKCYVRLNTGVVTPVSGELTSGQFRISITETSVSSDKIVFKASGSWRGAGNLDFASEIDFTLVDSFIKAAP